MSYILCPIFTGTQISDPDGNPLANGKIYTYKAGTTTPITTYQDDEDTPHTNPIELDSSAYVGSIWLKTGVNYKFVITDENGFIIPQGTIDNVSFSSGGGGGGSVPLPLNQIAFGDDTSVTSSASFQYDPATKMIQFWQEGDTIVAPSFTEGISYVDTGYAEWALNGNAMDPESGLYEQPGIVVRANYDGTVNTFIPTLSVGSLTVNTTLNGAVKSVAGTSGLSPVIATAGSVSVGPVFPAISKTFSISITNFEQSLTASGFYPTVPYFVPDVGAVYRVSIRGSGNSSSAGSIQFKLKIGPSNSTSDQTVYTLTTTSASSGSNVPFKAEMELTVRSNGGSGTVFGSGNFLNNGTTGLSNSAVVVSNGSVQSVNFSVDTYISVSAITASTNQSITVNQIVIQRVL